MHVLRLRMYEGNLPIHPSACMKKERKKESVDGRRDFDLSCTRRRIVAHNTDVGDLYSYAVKSRLHACYFHNSLPQ